MENVIRHTPVRNLFAEVPGVNRTGQVLNELDGMTLWVLHVKAKIATRILVDRSWNVDTLRCQIVAQSTSITGFETDTDESIFIAFQARRDIDVLMIVDFECRAGSAALDGRGLERLSQPNNTRVESPRGVEVLCFDRNVCDTNNRWPRRPCLRAGMMEACGNEQDSGEASQPNTLRSDTNHLSYIGDRLIGTTISLHGVRRDHL